MKGIIGNIRGQKISGELKINVKKEAFNEYLINQRLAKEFPEYNLRAFSGIKQAIGPFIWEPREVFVEAVRMSLLGAARLVYPDRGYDLDTNLALLYDAILDFTLNRDQAIKAFKFSKR